MTVTQLLVSMILISQGLAAAVLFITSRFDRSTFEKVGKTTFMAVPTMMKIVQLFRNTETPAARAFYFLAMIFVLFSFAAFILLIMHTARWALGL